MFKGKVYMYSNINGREEKLEREFDNPQEFHSFAKQTPAFQMRNNIPFLWLGGWDNFHNYLDNFLDQRLGLGHQESYENTSSLVDLDKYEKTLEEIEYQKVHKDEHTKQLKSTLQKLKEYKKKFKEENREDMMANIDEDIKKIEEELKKNE